MKLIIATGSSLLRTRTSLPRCSRFSPRPRDEAGPRLRRRPHAEIDATKVETIAVDPVAAGNRAAEGFGDVGDFDDKGTEAFGLAFDETDGAVLKGQDRIALVG